MIDKAQFLKYADNSIVKNKTKNNQNNEQKKLNRHCSKEMINKHMEKCFNISNC